MKFPRLVERCWGGFRTIWWCPQRGVPPVIILIFDWDFPWTKPSSELGVPPFSELEFPPYNRRLHGFGGLGFSWTGADYVVDRVLDRIGQGLILGPTGSQPNDLTSGSARVNARGIYSRDSMGIQWGLNHDISSGWWLGHPSEKYEFVNWDD